MSIALDVAKRSGQDIPVGALVVLDGEILTSSCNRVVKDLHLYPSSQNSPYQLPALHLCEILIYDVISLD